MPIFAYTARDMSGKQVTGTVEANAEREVAGILSEKSLFPVEVKASSAAPQAIFGGRKKVKAQTMALFYSQLAALLRAGGEWKTRAVAAQHPLLSAWYPLGQSLPPA